MLLWSLSSKQAEKEINFFQLWTFNINIDTNQIDRLDKFGLIFLPSFYTVPESSLYIPVCVLIFMVYFSLEKQIRKRKQMYLKKNWNLHFFGQLTDH